MLACLAPQLKLTGYVSVGGVMGPFPELQSHRKSTAIAVGETEVRA